MAAPSITLLDSEAVPNHDTYSIGLSDSGSDLAVGDLILAVISHNQSRSVGTPSGWTLLASEAETTNNQLDVFFRLAESGDVGGTTTFTATGTYSQLAGALFRVTGHGVEDSGDFVTETNEGTDSSAECDDLTTTENDSLLLWCEGALAAASATQADTTELIDLETAYSRQFTVYSETRATAGTGTARTITLDTTSKWVTISVAIPSGGAPPAAAKPALWMGVCI